MIYIKLPVLGRKDNIMEIKAKLNKPYTEEARMDFIVSQNHRLGYEIRETETALEAWGLTGEEKQKQEKQRRKLEVKNNIKELNEYSMDYIRIGDKAGLDIINNIISGLEVELTN